MNCWKVTVETVPSWAGLDDTLTRRIKQESKVPWVSGRTSTPHVLPVLRRPTFRPNRMPSPRPLSHGMIMLRPASVPQSPPLFVTYC